MLTKVARLARKSELAWRYFFNFTPTLTYMLSRPALVGEPTRVLSDLNRDGIAFTSAQTLLGAESCYPELESTVAKLEVDQAERLEEARVTAGSRPADEKGSDKNFVFHLLGQKPKLDADHICVRFALQKPVLQIANAYFGMYTKLKYFNIWHHFTTEHEARSSQLWHYDRDDLYFVLKVFVLLTNVDEGAGPFTYAPGTHFKGGLRREPDYLFEEGCTRRSSDSQMAKVVPAERWAKGVGPAGTIIFADTHGYHKGGFARFRDRIMYTCMFTSPLGQPDLFERAGEIPELLDPEQAFALSV
jgi:hypothetical protein